MADTQVLDYAAKVQQLATQLFDEISKETERLEHACNIADNTLNQMDKISMEADRFSNEIQNVQQESRTFLDKHIRLSQDISRQNTSTRSLADTMQTALNDFGNTSYEHRLCPELPDFTLPQNLSANDLTSEQFPVNQAIWDELATELTTFAEQMNDTIEQIDQMKQSIEKELNKLDNTPRTGIAKTITPGKRIADR